MVGNSLTLPSFSVDWAKIAALRKFCTTEGQKTGGYGVARRPISITIITIPKLPNSYDRFPADGGTGGGPPPVEEVRTAIDFYGTPSPSGRFNPNESLCCRFAAGAVIGNN